MKIKLCTLGQAEQFSLFQTKEEFQHHVVKWVVDYRREFSKGELVALQKLVYLSTDIPGVCYLTIHTILKEIHREKGGMGISRSTFKRMTRKAKKIGILTIYKTERENGSQSTNLYVFQPYPTTRQVQKTVKGGREDE